MREFEKTIQAIREDARKHLEDGAVTSSYKAEKEAVIHFLNSALASELVCVLRYRYHYEMARGIHSQDVSAQFKEHADQEQEHANEIAARISQLGGKPNFNPAGLADRAQTDYVQGNSLREMIIEDLVAERIVIGLYQEFIRYVGNSDSSSRTLVEHILKEEEEHAEELWDLLFSMFGSSEENYFTSESHSEAVPHS